MPPGSLNRRCEPLLLEAMQYEIIDWILRPLSVLNFRKARTTWRNEGPVALVNGALLDPAADQVDLFRCQVPVVPGRWHALRCRLRANALVKPAVVQIPWNDEVVSPAIPEDAFLCVQVKGDLTFAYVRAMAGEAVVRENRADVPAKTDRVIASG